MVMQPKYSDHWHRINGLQGFGADALLHQLERYAATLATTQGDTFTQPFEVPADGIGQWDTSLCSLTLTL